MVFALDDSLIGYEFVEFDIKKLDGSFGLILLGEGSLVLGQFLVDCVGQLLDSILEILDFDLLAVDLLISLLKVGYLHLVLEKNLIFHLQKNCLQNRLVVFQLRIHLFPDILRQLFQVLVFDHIRKNLAQGSFYFC